MGMSMGIGNGYVYVVWVCVRVGYINYSEMYISSMMTTVEIGHITVETKLEVRLDLLEFAMELKCDLRREFVFDSFRSQH